MTRYAIVDAAGHLVETFHLGPCGAVVPAVDSTYATKTDACLALIFQFPDCPDLRPVPVADVLPPLPPQPGIDS